MWCQSQTWDIEFGCALIHSNHIGARANIDACILRLHILNGQDSIEIHGPVRQLVDALARPNNCVRWQFAFGCADEAHCKSHIHTL